jgi:hypothetical protein
VAERYSSRSACFAYLRNRPLSSRGGDYQAKSPAIPQEAIAMQMIQAAMTSRILSNLFDPWHHLTNEKASPTKADFSDALGALTVRDITHRQKKTPARFAAERGL